MVETNLIDVDEVSPEQINLGPRWSSEEIEVFFDSKSILSLIRECLFTQYTQKLFAKIEPITSIII